MDIKEMRTKLGLTQEKFAQMIGVTFGTINRWENGKGKPSPLAVEMLKVLERELLSKEK